MNFEVKYFGIIPSSETGHNYTSDLQLPDNYFSAER